MPLAGSLWSIGLDVLGFLLAMERRYGPVVRVRVGLQPYHLVNDPALIEQVLWRQADRFTRASPSSRKLQDITGTSLLTTVGPPWLARRKLIAPYFNRAGMIGQAPAMRVLAAARIAAWGTGSADAVTIDATDKLSALTCAIASQILFGTAVEDPALAEALEGILAHHWRRLKDPLQIAHHLPTASRRAFDAGNRTVAGIVGLLGRAPGGDTLLGALQAAAEDPGIALTVADELVTLLVAGHETTANALGWALHLLALHPEEQAALRAEAQAATDAQWAAVDLPVSLRVFQEAMRLYPPIWLIERTAIGVVDIGGFTIPDGGSVIVSPWVVHRAGWDDAERFRPDRFRRAPTKNTYIPFGIGPHACVGANLALTEGPLVLALVARRWRWRPAPRAIVVPRPGLTLRMQRPLRLILEPA